MPQGMTIHWCIVDKGEHYVTLQKPSLAIYESVRMSNNEKTSADTYHMS